jgi:hypothetical protein
MKDTLETSMLFKCAVGATLLVPIAGVISAVAFRHWVIFPGSLVSLVLYGVLGYFAVHGRDWARWILFAFMLGTAMLGVVFTFVRFEGGTSSVGFNRWVAIIPLFYGLVAAGLAVQPRRLVS